MKTTTTANQLILTVATLGLIACGNSSGKKDGPAGEPRSKDDIPTQLSFQPRAGAPLSAAQKEQFQALGQKTKSIGLGSFIWKPENESAQDRRRREQSLAKEPTQIKEIVQRLQRDCQISHPKTETSETGKGVGAVRKIVTSSSIQGDRCPVFLTDTQNRNETIVELNKEQLTGKIIIDGTGETINRAQDPALIQQLGVRETNLKTLSRGVAFYEKEKTWAQATATTNGQAILSNGQIVSLNMELTTLRRPQLDEMTAHLTFHIESTDFHVSIQFHQDKGQPARVKYFINGSEISTEEAKNFLSLDIDTAAAQPPAETDTGIEPLN